MGGAEGRVSDEREGSSPTQRNTRLFVVSAATRQVAPSVGVLRAELGDSESCRAECSDVVRPLMTSTCSLGPMALRTGWLG